MPGAQACDESLRFGAVGHRGDKTEKTALLNN
jgi:hypothetical protein